jgi:phenylacetate-CoA oxygenase PaaI subunit
MSNLEPEEIPADARQALGRLIESLADNKAAMGRRYGEWAVSAPTLESGVAAAAMAQDELGHARSTYPLLKQLGVAEPDAEGGMETTGCIPLLAEPLPDWEAFVAVNLVVDGMLTAFVEAAHDSAFAGLQQRARKILQEERSHESHAGAWTRRLAGDPQSRERLPEALRSCWVQIAEWPGTSHSYVGLTELGLLSGDPDSIRARVRQRVAEALEGTSVEAVLS